MVHKSEEKTIEEQYRRGKFSAEDQNVIQLRRTVKYQI